MAASASAPPPRSSRAVFCEAKLGPGEGLDHECVANCDEIHTIRKQRLTRRRGALGIERVGAIDTALRLSLGLDSE